MNELIRPLTGDPPGWRTLVATGFSAAHIDVVLALCDEPHRAYHDARHLWQMLGEAARLAIVLLPAQALAVLFHDAVCVPGATPGANEALSAQLLRICGQGVEVSVVAQATAIIADTAQHVPTSSRSCRGARP